MFHVFDPLRNYKVELDHTQTKQVPEHQSVSFIILPVSRNVKTNKLALIEETLCSRRSTTLQLVNVRPTHR